MWRPHFITIFLFGLICVSVTNAFVSLIPPSKELIYQYQAHITTGTPLIVPHASSFKLFGELHVQKNGNVTVFHLKNLVYKLYNGILDHSHEYKPHEVPFPNEASGFNKPFGVMYDIDGKIIGITTESHEEYVRNMQKAIATVFQMDVNHVLSVNVPHGFITEEPSIWGMSQTNYNIQPMDNNEIIVEKMHEMHTSHHIYEHIIQNVDPQTCESYAEPLLHDSQRRYHLIKKNDNQHIADHIEANGGYYYLPLNAKSDAEYIFVNQTFNLTAIKDATEGITIDMSHMDRNLKYIMVGDENVEELPDWTHGRKMVDIPKLQSQIIEMLDEAKHYLNDNHFDQEQPSNDAAAALIHRINRAMSRLKVNDIEKVHDIIKQKTDNEIITIFYEILPLVGTKASSLFIKDLVVNKKIKSEFLIEILQDLPRHVKYPTIKLVQEMDVLIKLPESMDWNVRKAAILAFGGLVHKAHTHHHYHHYSEEHDDTHQQQQQSGEDEEKTLDKYLVNLVEKVKSSQNYKEQIIYLKAIGNMRLPSAVKHLTPAIEGLWSHDHNIKYHAMWAVYPVVDDTTAFELFWPLLANHNEHTEIRILAYYIIMTKDPSLSRVANIYWLLQHEPNEEVYNFHYTFVKSLMNSVEPCHEKFNNHMRKFFKFMQPSSHGMSMYHIMNFKDPVYHFSGGFHGVIINSNTTKCIGLIRTFQVLNQYYHEYVIKIRIHGHTHGLNKFHLDNMMDSDQIWKFFSDLKSMMKELLVEVVVIKHGIVKNVYIIDEDNLDDLKHISSFFTKKDIHTNRNYIDGTYEKSIQIHLPTDIGILSIWQLNAASISKAEVNIKKEIGGKIMNVNLDNKYSTWLNTHHGFVVYNPIVDVWHGCWRSQTYNDMLPLYMDMSWNKQQQSVKVSWKRHNENEKVVAGIKTHARQFVFVWDEYQRNILKTSCQECKEWVPVQLGEDYKHNVTMEVDSVNTGTHWKTTFFDTEHHITNGSIKHKAHQFFDRSMKSFETPIGQLMMGFMNWYYYLKIWPQTSNLGLLMRVTPSVQQSVSNVDMTIRWNCDVTKTMPTIDPALKLSSRLTYAVKNKEQSLKTWDVNALVDINQGHTVNKLKLLLTRIVPNQKDYKVCIEGVKKYGNNEVNGHVNVAMSQTKDGKCSTDDTVIDINMSGKPSDEQTHKKHVYGHCHHFIPYQVQPYHTMQCIVDHSTVRDYVYNVKTTNVPTEFKKMFWKFVDALKSYYYSYYTHSSEPEETVGENNMKIEVNYPVEEHEVDIKMVTPQGVHQFESLPMKHLEMLGVKPDSTVFSMWYQLLHGLDQVDHCVVHTDDLYFNDEHVHHVVKTDWSLHVGDDKENPKRAVYLKQEQDHLAVKIVEQQNVLEVMPKGDHYQMILNGNIVIGEMFHGDWVYMDVVKSIHEDARSVVVFIKSVGILVECHKDHVNIVVPHIHDIHWHGHCYSH